MERIIAERLLEGEELSVEEQDRIFLQVNPPDNKGRVYGLGSYGETLTQSFSVSQQQSQGHGGVYTQVQVEHMVNQAVTPLQTEIGNLRDEQARMNQRMEELCRLYMSQNTPGPSS